MGSAKGNTAVLKPISEESVIAQTYTNLKQKHPDAVLLFRKGDFYNTYNDDAKVSADKLGITLTTPTKLKGIDRLASFPHQQLDIYLPKLVRAGLRVAIVDEPMENQVKSTQVHDLLPLLEASSVWIEVTVLRPSWIMQRNMRILFVNCLQEQ